MFVLNEINLFLFKENTFFVLNKKSFLFVYFPDFLCIDKYISLTNLLYFPDFLYIDKYISLTNEHTLFASCTFRVSTRRLLHLFHSDDEPTNEVIPKLISE